MLKYFNFGAYLITLGIVTVTHADLNDFDQPNSLFKPEIESMRSTGSGNTLSKRSSFGDDISVHLNKFETALSKLREMLKKGQSNGEAQNESNPSFKQKLSNLENDKDEENLPNYRVPGSSFVDDFSEHLNNFETALLKLKDFLKKGKNNGETLNNLNQLSNQNPLKSPITPIKNNSKSQTENPSEELIQTPSKRLSNIMNDQDEEDLQNYHAPGSSYCDDIKENLNNFETTLLKLKGYLRKGRNNGEESMEEIRVKSTSRNNLKPSSLQNNSKSPELSEDSLKHSPVNKYSHNALKPVPSFNYKKEEYVPLKTEDQEDANYNDLVDLLNSVN